MKGLLDVSMLRINTLNPKLVPSATKVFERCHKEKIPVYIVWGSRTHEQQDVLFRLGRSIPGPIQTVHRPGRSPHNLGLALDFCLLFNDTLLSWEDVYPRDYWRNKWLKVVRYFEEEGWEAGWRWPAFEPGHVQNLLGMTLTQLYEQIDDRYNRNTDIRKQDQD